MDLQTMREVRDFEKSFRELWLSSENCQPPSIAFSFGHILFIFYCQNLRKSKYLSREDFLEHVSLIKANSVLYNGEPKNNVIILNESYNRLQVRL